MKRLAILSFILLFLSCSTKKKIQEGDSFSVRSYYQAVFSKYADLIGKDYFDDVCSSAHKLIDASVILNAYLDMYEGTGSDRYISQYVRLINQIIVGSDCISGTPRWKTTQGYNLNFVENNNFENPDKVDPRLPIDWKLANSRSGRYISLQQGGSFIEQRARQNKRVSPNAGKSKNTYLNIQSKRGGPLNKINTDLSFLFSNKINYFPKLQYQIEFEAKSTGRCGGKLSIYDQQLRKNLFEFTLPESDNDGQWRKYKSSKWIAPESPINTLVLSLSQNFSAQSGDVAFDNIIIRPYAEFLYYDGYFAVSLARFVRLFDDGDIGNQKFASDRNRYFRLANAILKKWESQIRVIDKESTVMVFPENGSSAYINCSYPYNISLLIAATYTFLSKTNAGNLEKAQKLFNSYKVHLTAVRKDSLEYYKWHYWDIYPQLGTEELRPDFRPKKKKWVYGKDPFFDKKNGKIYKSHYWEDASHAGNTLYATWVGYKYGEGIFDEAHMQKFTNVLEAYALVDTTNCDIYHNMFYGSKPSPKLHYWRTWPKYAALNPEIMDYAQKRLRLTLKERRTSINRPMHYMAVVGAIVRELNEILEEG